MKIEQVYSMGATGGKGVKQLVFTGIPGELTPSLAELTH